MEVSRGLNFDNLNLLVVGDVMLDRYWFGSSSRLSPEAPVPVVLVENRRDTAGGAANVALNVAGLGAQAQLLSALGQDPEGQALAKILEEQNVKCQFLRDERLQTTVKLRVISRAQQIVRIDFERRPDNEIFLPLLKEFEALLKPGQPVVFSDYGKGGLTHIVQMVAQAKRLGVPVLIDPKGSDYTPYKGADIVTPNLSEFAQVAGSWSSEADFEKKAFALQESLELGALLVTRSEDGMSLFTQGRHIHIPAQVREVFDVSGAGDTVIATLGVCMAAGFELEHAAQVANIAASIVVGKVGTAPIGRDELEKLL